MCMPTPNNVSGFGYSWGFTSSADLTKGEVETPSSLSYTLGNTVSFFPRKFSVAVIFYKYCLTFTSF